MIVAMEDGRRKLGKEGRNFSDGAWQRRIRQPEVETGVVTDVCNKEDEMAMMEKAVATFRERWG